MTDVGCAQCPVGMQRDASRDDTCQPCHYGWTTLTTGTTSIDRCIRKLKDIDKLLTENGLYCQRRCVCVCVVCVCVAQSVCQQAFSLLANRCLRPWVRILHSAEEDNLSPFDSNIACLCQSIIYIYIYIYLGHLRDGLWGEVFYLILGSSVSLRAGIQSIDNSVSDAMAPIVESWSLQRKTTCLLLHYKLLLCAKTCD